MFDAWDSFLERHRGLCAALLFLFTFVLFRKMLANGFVFDDSPLIVENPFIRNPHFWKHIFTGDAWAFQGGHSSLFYRPLQFSVYWLIYRLADSDPAPFHLVNLTLYAATGWLVYRLGRKLTGSETAALAGAILWLVHPLHMEAAAWISGLPDLGAGFFYLLAFLLFCDAESADKGRFGKHALAALAFLPALFFKEMALSFPLMVLAYWFFFSRARGPRFAPLGAGSARARRQDGRAAWLAYLLPYLAAASAYLWIRHLVLGRMAATAHLWRITPKVVAAGVALLGQHAKLFFLPIHMDVFRSFDLTSSVRSPWGWLTVAVLLAAATLRWRAPVPGFLIVWWGVALLPVLDIRQLSFPQIADRFSYLPSVGLCLAISYLCVKTLETCAPGVWRRGLALAPVTIMFCFWMFKSLQVVPNWRNNEAWTHRTREQSPNSVVLHLQLAENLMFREGNDEAALREYEEARHLRGEFLADGRAWLRLQLGSRAHRDPAWAEGGCRCAVPEGAQDRAPIQRGLRPLGLDLFRPA